MFSSEAMKLAGQVAPVFSAIGILIGATAAWATYLFYHRRSSEAAWGDTFRKLYEEFWKSDDIAEMRKYLASEAEYKKIEGILAERLLSSQNDLSSTDNDILDRIDRFCALMVRILSFGDRSMTRRQRDLFDPLFTYWISAIKRREKLIAYIRIYWKPLYTRLERFA